MGAVSFSAATSVFSTEGAASASTASSFSSTGGVSASASTASSFSSTGGVSASASTLSSISSVVTDSFSASSLSVSGGAASALTDCFSSSAESAFALESSSGVSTTGGGVESISVILNPKRLSSRSIFITFVFTSVPTGYTSWILFF